MSTQSFTLTSYDFTTTTGIRAWGNQVSSAIQATGITKTSDTGQIDWTTTTSGSGYEVYRFNDTLQSTAPVYLKVTYSVSTSWLYISSVAVGSGTNGAGALTGVTQSVGYPGTTITNGSSTTTNMIFRFNYNAALGFFALDQWDDQSVASSAMSTRGLHAVSRTCTTSETPTANGVLFQAWGASNSSGSYYTLSFDTGAVTNLANLVPGFNALASLQYGTTVQFLRVQACYPHLYVHPQVLYYADADVPSGTTVSLSPYGTSHTYITTGKCGSSFNGAYAILWE